MRIFRDIFLCFALLLTLVGNTATTTACLADGEISFVGNAACAETRETARADRRAAWSLPLWGRGRCRRGRQSSSPGSADFDGKGRWAAAQTCAGAHADRLAGTPCAHDADAGGDFRAPHEPLTVALDDDLAAAACPNGVPAPDAFFFAEFFSALFDAAALRSRAVPSAFPPGDDALRALLRAPNRAGVLPLLA